jgi:hypothetical protein
MSLTYVPKNKKTDDFDANVAGAGYLHRLHEVLGLPLCTEPGAKRVPYTMDKKTAVTCAKRIRTALVVLGEIGVVADETSNDPTSTAQMAEAWADFLEGCNGYEAI